MPTSYSSAGVRDQTAELSSSFLSDSNVARYFSIEPSSNNDSAGSISTGNRLVEAIEERSEPVSPEPLANGDPSSSSRWTNDFFSFADATRSADHTADAASRSNSVVSHSLHFQRPRLDSDVLVTPDVLISDDSAPVMDEHAPLLPRERLSSIRRSNGQRYDAIPKAERATATSSKPGLRQRLRLPHFSTKGVQQWAGRVGNPAKWDGKAIAQTVLLRPASMLPAVFLGLLLNLLDALSYGIILFPRTDPFASMGADGVSIFYVSCIVSQIVYASGSIFRGGVGSEMIEVVPFFHKMAFLIIGIMDGESDDAIRATVITSYAMSSILTGVVFFVLGSARLGTLVSFFPHSILVGCIGGVGIFLFLTGIEVSARLPGSFEFTGETLEHLAFPSSIAQWVPPLVLAIILLVVKRYYDRPWLVPAYYIGITAIFYIITAAVPSITMDGLRSNGWVFEAPDANVSFYNFYSYYQFGLVDWNAIWRTVPSQLALTFFGILHVPINIPNLAMKTQEDNVSIDRELIMHGVSNTLSGCVGSIQNYLVYVNSVLFMDTGGDSRLAGFLLAAATAGLWVAGPVVIGYVPVMVVGTLIYYLGIDLAKEALIDTYGRLHSLEYITIVVIALVMGIHDFVVGVAVGIGLACLVYVVQTSRKTVIRAQFSGAIAESTVRRHARQRLYLHRVGPQIRVVKLGGYLFFGSIVSVEKTVRAMIDAEAFAAEPIRYLILDLAHVTGIDFSAAEAFGRMNRVLHRRRVEMIFSSVNLQGEVGRSLQMDGLFVAGPGDPPVPKVYEDLNGALEACENSLLVTLLEKQESSRAPGATHTGHDSPPMPVPSPSRPTSPPPSSPSSAMLTAAHVDQLVGSPRTTLRQQAATQTITEQRRSPPEASCLHHPQPLPLLLQAFQDLTTYPADFWARAVPYLTRRTFAPGTRLYDRHDRPNGFYLLESGLLRAAYTLEQGHYHELIVAGTTCGELPFFSETERTSRVIAETECVVWQLSPRKWDELQKAEPEVARELLKVCLRLSVERMNAVTSYVLITAS